MSLLRNSLSRISSLKTAIRKCSNASESYEKSLNQVQLIGRSGGDPEKRGSDSHPVVIFSLATGSNYKNAEDNSFTQKVQWHRICIFKPILRETVYNYLKKGQRIYVSGHLSYGELEDETGRKTILTSIIADNVIFFNR